MLDRNCLGAQLRFSLTCVLKRFYLEKLDNLHTYSRAESSILVVQGPLLVKDFISWVSKTCMRDMHKTVSFLEEPVVL